jgi:molybdate transport system substrate-binding protein
MPDSLIRGRPGSCAPFALSLSKAEAEERPGWRGGMLRLRGGIAIAALLATALPASNARAASAFTIAAAVSLRAAMPEVVKEFEKQYPAPAVTVTYGASGQLRQQVEAGGPIDVVVFASAEHVDLLAERGLIVAGTRRVVASNSLVLVGPAGAAPLTFATIDRLPAGEMLAIGEPRSVPAGHYAREALQALGKWETMRDRLVFGGHVAAVLQYARRGEAGAAIVYSTDVQGVDGVVVLDRASGAWAPQVETVAAAVKGGEVEKARVFLDLLASRRGSAIFAAHGFGAPAAEVAEKKP